MTDGPICHSRTSRISGRFITDPVPSLAAPFRFAAKTGLSRRIAFTGSDATKRSLEFATQCCKVAFDAIFAPDQHVIRSGNAQPRKQFPRQSTQAAFHAVTHHRIADLLGNSDAESK